MLQLRRHLTESKLDFPHSVRGSIQHKFAFAPIATEEDELLDEIEDAKQNTWEFGDQAEGETEAFWDHMLEDVRSDPEWNFTSDD